MILGYDPWKKTHARAFRSEDRVSWTATGLPGGNRWPNGVSNVSPEVIIATPKGLLALGQDRIPRAGLPARPNGVVWRSRTGTRWSHIATIRNAFVTDIATGPDGLSVVGERVAKGGARTPAVWSSTDGKAWPRQRLDRDGPPPTAIAVSRDGVRLVVGHKIRNDLSTWTRLWRSEDGQAWSRVPLPSGIGEDERISVRGPVATPAGFLLFVRERDRLGETLWRSDTGLDWETVPLDDDWSLSRSWVVAQPWPWRSLIIEARAFPGSTRQPSLLLTSDGGSTWCWSDGPRAAPFTAFDATAGPDESLIMVGGAGIQADAWVVRWAHDAGLAGDPAAFPCSSLPSIAMSSG